MSDNASTLKINFGAPGCLLLAGVRPADILLFDTDKTVVEGTGDTYYTCTWLKYEKESNSCDIIQSDLCERFTLFYNIRIDSRGTIYSGNRVLPERRVIARFQNILTQLGKDPHCRYFDLTKLPKQLTDILRNQHELKSSGKVSLVKASDIEDEEQRFLIYPYLPIGAITILQAEPGVGKTFLACGLSSLVTRGKRLLDTYPVETGNVLLLTTEDDKPVIKARLRASNADLDRCLLDKTDDILSFQDDRIETAIKDNGIKLVVFDPLQAFLGSRVDMFRANETRPILMQLSAMAKRCGCAVMLICHTAKDSKGKNAVYKSLGSADIPGCARSILQVYPAPGTEQKPGEGKECLAIHIKSSSQAPGKSIRYKISNNSDALKFEFTALTDETEKIYQRELIEETANKTDRESDIATLIRRVATCNPKGVDVSWEDLQTFANVDNLNISDDGQSLAAEIRKLKPVFDRAGIAVELHRAQSSKPIQYYNEKYNPHNGRGVRISLIRATTTE